jgi:RNA polymerase sigma-70 factor (ECF subfamily)
MSLANWPFGRTSEARKYLVSQRQRLYRVAFSWCHNDALADDLVQEALLRACKYCKGLRDQKALDGWLFRILSNCWHDELRRRRDMQDISTVTIYAQQDIESEHYHAELIHKVHLAMAQLPAAQREVVSLVDIAELSYEQVASALEVPVGTVMSRLNRARVSLRRQLEDCCQQTASNILPFGVRHEE